MRNKAGTSSFSIANMLMPSQRHQYSDSQIWRDDVLCNTAPYPQQQVLAMGLNDELWPMQVSDGLNKEVAKGGLGCGMKVELRLLD